MTPASVPAWRRQAAAGLGAQLTLGAAGLGIILVTERATDSFVWAGLVTGGFGVGAGIARPIQGRLIDRRGAGGVLALCGIVHAAALVGLSAASRVDAAAGALLALGFLAGLAVPPVSASMRVSWGRAATKSDRTAAFSMVTLAQELAILLGPLTFSGIAAVASAWIALAVVAGLAGASTLALAGLLHSPRPHREHSPTRRRVLRAPGLLLTLAIAVLLGLAIGAIELAAPALATAADRPAAAGLLIAALSAGGVLGAIVFSALGPLVRPPGWLIVLLGLFAIALAPLAWTESLPVTGFVLLAAGIAMNPALTALALLVNDLTPANAAEAFGWLSTAIAAGTAAGTVLAGIAAQHVGGPQAAFFVAAAAAGTGTLVAALIRPALTTTSISAHAVELDAGPTVTAERRL